MFDALFHLSLDLDSINLAHLIMLPKVENAQKLSEFRPISIICYLPKLISKVLNNRLAVFLPELILNMQTGFVKGRLISENFIMAREVIANMSSCGDPAVLLKLDFSKAFDSVSWPFLFSILQTRGFPTRFVKWIKLLLFSARSVILLNGIVGPSFQHKWGLRQGDPLSPSLFIIAADVLSRMVQAVALSVNFSLTRKLRDPYFLLQYADDTLIFSIANGTALQSLNLVLHSFSKVSGIDINWTKTCFVPFNIPHTLSSQLQSLLCCPQASLPLTYLGLPLTHKRPDRLCFQKLIEKVKGKLAGWKSPLMTRAGRFVLAISVLSSIPVFFMSAFHLPAWVIRDIDRIRRSFIWKRNGVTGTGIPLLAWDRVCLPKQLGGFGLQHLKLQNISLLLRWIWRLYSEGNSLWSSSARLLYAKLDPNLPPMAWNKEGSFFWKQLLALRFYFQLSVQTKVNSGRNSLLWFDSWGGSPMHFFNYSPTPPAKQYATVRQAFDIVPAPMTLQQSLMKSQLLSLNLVENNDTFHWRWRADGRYTSASVYKTLIYAGKVKFKYNRLWKLKLPPSGKLFLLLLAHGRLLTQDQLQKRNMQVQPMCHLCQGVLLETAEHLFFQCPFSSQIWWGLGFRTSLHSDFLSILSLICSEHTSHQTATLYATCFWTLWLERNKRIFRDGRRTNQAIQEWIIQQASLFLKFC
ncbi:RNA-directed DNA polymerase (reverse transcriptase)-related family protein [Rhynchospora pubera]|uniref:RNA-directed DNA polymerase (Reverse transcriptase)-related family protein n=1 Tax=Rhynchospora pubera TaxID=906938 RepID=A0AAV8F362_9POAL|nr:RNA-directed DNA polymerase (reverse transcriptase)-related family protein [Rhynchospora pubera]